MVPYSIQSAKRLIAEWHRHHKPPVSGLFALAVATDDGAVRGAAIVGRPVARMLDDGWTCEVIRVATDGTPNACSALYGACWRSAQALGWRRMVTYTLPQEGGSSLRGAGWRNAGSAGGGSWNKPSRPRVDKAPTDVKTRWEVGSAGPFSPHPDRVRVEADGPQFELLFGETWRESAGGGE